jgi:hypothetical protein
VAKAKIRVAMNPMMKTIAYLSLNQSNLSILNGTMIGRRANNGRKYLALTPMFVEPTSAQVRSWMKHVPTYIISNITSDPHLAFELNLNFFGWNSNVMDRNIHNNTVMRV